MRWTPFVAALAAASFGPGQGWEATWTTCSVSPFLEPPPPGTTFLLGTALADTAEAGEAPPRFAIAGDGKARPIYGQVVRIERLAGAGAEEVGPETDTAVLVPWGYDRGCAPDRWWYSARWAEPGLQGLYTVRLRERTRWAGGLPTFDAEGAFFQPYPYAEGLLFSFRLHEGKRGYHPTNGLSPLQLFNLLSELPETLDVKARDEALFAWASKHRDLVTRFPASTLLTSARRRLETERLKTLEPEIAGTYRLVVAFRGQPRRTLHVRTLEHPSWPFWEAEVDQLRETVAAGEPTDGYAMTIFGASDEAALPGTLNEAKRSACYVGAMLVRHRPLQLADRSMVWRATMDARRLSACLLPPRDIQSFHEQAGQLYRSFATLPWGVFRVDRKGDVRFAQYVGTGDSTLLEVRGERISRVTVKP